MEKNEEIAGGHMSTKYRELDTRTGRWWSVDPEAAKYYSWSPYNLSLNSPILAYDPSGSVVVFPFDTDGVSEAYFNRVYDAADATTKAKLDLLKASDVVYEINVQVPGYDMIDSRVEGHTIADFSISGETVIAISLQEGQSESAIIQGLGDELEHAHQFETGQIGYEKLPDGSVQVFAYDMQDEIDSKKGAVKTLNNVNKKEGTNLELSPMHKDFVQAMKAGAMKSFFEKYIAYKFDGKQEPGTSNNPQKTTAVEKKSEVEESFKAGRNEGYIYRQKNSSNEYETERVEKE